MEAILDEKKERGKISYLIKWEGYDESHNSWEPATNIAKTNPVLKAFLLVAAQR